MTSVTVTRGIACAHGHQCGDNQMRKAGRKRWNLDDYNEAVRGTNTLLMHVPASMGGLQGLPLTDKQLTDLGLSPAAEGSR